MSSGLEFLIRFFGGGGISPADFGEGADGNVWFFYCKGDWYMKISQIISCLRQEMLTNGEMLI